MRKFNYLFSGKGTIVRLLVMCLVLVGLQQVSLAQVEVAYVTNVTNPLVTGGAGDPIIPMLKADPNIILTVIKQDADDTGGPIDLSGYDVVIAQESFGSTSTIYKRGQTLGIGTIPVPFLHNKAFTLRGGRGFADGEPGTGGETKGAQGTIHLTVEAANQTNSLFSGISFVDDSVKVFQTWGHDRGDTPTDPNDQKGLQYATDVYVEGTYLGAPSVAPANATVSFNQLSAGDSIGSEELLADAFFFCMNFGAMSANGNNLTREGLTLWRNAVYILGGQTPPTTLVELPSATKKVAYVTLNKVMDASATQPDNDPIIQTLSADPTFDVTVITLDDKDNSTDSTLDFSNYDLVIGQEPMGSQAAIWKGSLGIGKIDKPFIFNKAFNLRAGRGFADGAAGTGGEVADDFYLKSSSTGNELFKGITFVDDSIQIFLDGADDAGALVGTKGLQYAVDVVTNPANTPLAMSAKAPANATIGINQFAAGDSIASEEFQADAFTFTMNFGAISAAAGSNITAEGLTLWRNAAYILTGLTPPDTLAPALESGETPFDPADHTIVFVTDDTGDSTQTRWLEAKGFTVTPWWPAAHPTVTAEEETALQAGDLIIIGRSGNSGELSAIQDYFHDANDPILNNSQYGSRSSTMKWFNTTTTSRLAGAGITDTLNYLVEVPADEVFEGVTLTAEDSISWDIAPNDFISVNAAARTESNFDFIVTRDSLIGLARLSEQLEYYTDAGVEPLGYRTYFGMGNDSWNGDAAGPDTTNYFPLTADARMVYFNEIARLVTLGTTDWTKNIAEDDATLAEITVNGTAIDFDGTTISFTLPAGTTAAPVVAATATSSTATVDITQATAVDGDATILVTAGDGTTTETYTISFDVEVAGLRALFVGTAGSLADQVIVDSLEMWGYPTRFIDGGDYATYDEDAHLEFEFAFISESIGSSSASPYGTAGMPIDLILNEPYALNKTDIVLGAVGASAQTDVVTAMEIVEDKHPITIEQYTAGQVVQIFDTLKNADLWTERVFQYQFDLSTSGVSYTVLGVPALTGTEDGVEWNDLPSWVVIDGGQAIVDGGTIPATTEIIIHGFHQGISYQGTADYWNQVRRSVQYLTDELPTGIKTSNELSSKVNLYPNPTSDRASLEFVLDKAGVVEITMLNINGQLMNTVDAGFRTAGKNVETFDVSNLSQGVYFVKVKADGFSKTLRLLVK